MRLLHVKASSSGLRRETFPFKPPREAQQGQVNRPLHRESHGQIEFSLKLLCDVIYVIKLFVYSLLVLAGRGKRTKFVRGRKGEIT